MQTQLVEQPPGVCAAEGLLVAASIKDSLQRTSPCLLAWCQPVRCGPLVRVLGLDSNSAEGYQSSS